MENLKNVEENEIHPKFHWLEMKTKHILMYVFYIKRQQSCFFF
jgi:hypothetical protein